MKKLYNFRLDSNLINDLDRLDGSRTSNVDSALRCYLHNDLQNGYNVNINYLSHLEDEVKYLRSQNNILLLSKVPLLSRIKMKLLDNIH